MIEVNDYCFLRVMERYVWGMAVDEQKAMIEQLYCQMLGWA